MVLYYVYWHLPKVGIKDGKCHYSKAVMDKYEEDIRDAARLLGLDVEVITREEEYSECNKSGR